MQEHRIIAFSSRAGFDKAGAATFDLDTTAGLLLYVLHVSSTLSDNLRAKVKPGEGFKINWDAFLRPFTLHEISGGAPCVKVQDADSYTTIFIPFHGLRLPATESTLVD